jgi:hypothetical protein
LQRSSQQDRQITVTSDEDEGERGTTRTTKVEGVERAPERVVGGEAMPVATHEREGLEHLRDGHEGEDVQLDLLRQHPKLESAAVVVVVPQQLVLLLLPLLMPLPLS